MASISAHTENSIKLLLSSFSEISADHCFDDCVQRRNEVLLFYNENKRLLSSLPNTENSPGVFKYYFDNEVAPIIKHYLIFLRNTMLEIHKSNVKQASKSISTSEWKSYLSESKNHIDLVTEEFNKNIEVKWNWIQSQDNQKKTQLDSTLIISPESIYSEQISTCGIQMSRIKNQDLEFRELSTSLNEIRQDICAHLKKYIGQEKSLEELLNDVNNDLSKNTDVQGALSKAQEKLQKIPIPADEEIEWLDHIDNKISLLPSLKPIIDYNLGLLSDRSLDLEKGTKKWVDVLLLPQHIQLRDQVEQNLSRVKTMLNNAQHKYQLLEGKKNKAYHDEIVNTINSLSSAQKSTTESISKEYRKIVNSVSAVLRANNLFNDQNWMITGYELTLGQLRIDTENIFKKSYEWLRNYIAQADWLPFLKIDSEINKTAKIAKVVQAKSYKELTGHYQRVFMSDGFLSDYYLVNRKKEMEQVDELSKLWTDDFGVSLILTGMPQCGKSTFAFQITKRHWQDQYIHLKPNSSIVIDGKNVETNANIGKALTDISNAIPKGKKYCLLLDDLFDWHDKTISLFENMSLLRSFVLSIHSNVVIIAVADSHLISRLQTVIRFQDAFMSTIDLSTIDKKEFITTLGHRHDATQNELYGLKQEPLTIKQIETLGQKIWSYTSRNVGSSLNEWVRCISQNEEGKWTIYFDPIKYPKIVDKKSATIFNVLLLYSNISEDELTTITDHIDKNIQESLLYNMLNSKVLTRSTESKISIEPNLRSEIQNQYERLDNYEHQRFVINSDVKIQGDTQKAKEEIEKLLFHYPFLTPDSEVSIKTKDNKFRITLLTSRLPSSIIDYLNDQQNKYQFQFIKRVKL